MGIIDWERNSGRLFEQVISPFNKNKDNILEIEGVTVRLVEVSLGAGLVFFIGKVVIPLKNESAFADLLDILRDEAKAKHKEPDVNLFEFYRNDESIVYGFDTYSNPAIEEIEGDETSIWSDHPIYASVDLSNRMSRDNIEWALKSLFRDMNDRTADLEKLLKKNGTKEYIENNLDLSEAMMWYYGDLDHSDTDTDALLKKSEAVEEMFRIAMAVMYNESYDRYNYSQRNKEKDKLIEFLKEKIPNFEDRYRK